LCLGQWPFSRGLSLSEYACCRQLVFDDNSDKASGVRSCLRTHITDSSLWLSFNLYFHKRRARAYFTESPDTVDGEEVGTSALLAI
jgi:hypothetical protein